MKIPRVALGVMCLLALNGCATSSTRKGPPADETLKEDATALLFNYSVSSDAPLTGECVLTLENLDLKKEVAVPLDLKRDYAIVEAAPGKYLGRRLQCADHRQHDHMEALMPDKMKAEDGKVNYAGAFDFTFETQTAHIIMKGHDSNEIRERLKRVMGELKPQTASRIVSAYSGTAINTVVLDAHNVENLGYSCTGPGAVDERKEQKFKYFKSYEMRKCLQSEVKTNPLTIGRLEYRARYAGRKLKKFDKTIDAHTFSNHFVECAEGKIKKLVPVSKEELTCEFRF